MVNLYGEVRLLDMSVMAYITRIKKTFLTDVMRYSNFIKIIIKILTNIMKKYLKKAVADWDKKKVLTLTISKQWFYMIVSAEKTEEYLEIKGYWVKRLFLLWNEDTCTNEKIPTHCVKNWDSISPEMANYCINSPYYKAIPYTHVLFINGYRKDSPRIEKEIESIGIGKHKKGLCPDNWLDTEFFIIKFKWYENKEFTKEDLPQHL